MSEDPRQAIADTIAASPAAGMASPRAHRPGDVIAEKYILVRYLARGGMAEVWLGTHASLKTDVAIKFMDPRIARDHAAGPYGMERFRFEAQISAQLGARTRRVVAVHDAGEHAGAPYLVMEYVPGRTLDAEVEADGPLAPARFADILDQVADALGAAHALGIVHRDIKPSNLLLVDEPDGKLTAKVADFGVAKALGTSLAVDRPRETQKGEMVGSPAFMSPEQARGMGQLDQRSDIWSLGVVAYETLTGQGCFEGLTLIDVFASITMARYRPPSSLRPDLPRGIDAWMERALAADPDDRFDSVEEMAKAFRALLAAPRRSARRPLAAGAIVVAVALAALLIARVRADAKPGVLVVAATATAATGAPSSSPTLAPLAQTAATTGQAPVNMSELPATDDPRGGRSARPRGRPPATASPGATHLEPVAPVPLPTVAPVAPPPPVKTAAPKSNPKEINPSEIQ